MDGDGRYVKIIRIEKKVNSINVIFESSSNMSNYIIDNHHEIEYLSFNYDLRKCPDSIAIIPTLSNLLPLIWFFDITFIADEIDKTFYENIPKIKEGYELMYPFINFKGKLIFNKIVDNSYDAEDNSVALFSQGIDSINTVINNLDENLYLITLHGSDIPINDAEGFNILSRKIVDFSSLVGCEYSFVKTNFRKYLNHPNLSKELPDAMNKNWWHQLQHGIAIISHATIAAYLKKSKHIFIASSNTENKAKMANLKFNRCASSPIIDNNFKFSGCNTIHDGYDFERIDKLKNIVRYSNDKKQLTLRVCFTSTDGENCSQCEKCSRSIMGLISEYQDPNEYGFNVNSGMLYKIKENLDDFKRGKEKKMAGKK